MKPAQVRATDEDASLFDDFIHSLFLFPAQFNFIRQLKMWPSMNISMFNHRKRTTRQ